MSIGIVGAAYVAAAVLFILSLGGLSGQESAKRAVWYGIAGMALAVGDATFDIPSLGRSAEGVVTQDLKTLATRLKAVKGEYPDQASIIVTAEDTVPYGDLVHVIDACLASGLAQVSVTGV